MLTRARLLVFSNPRKTLWEVEWRNALKTRELIQSLHRKPWITLQKTLERSNQRGFQIRNTNKLISWIYFKKRAFSPFPYPIPKILAVGFIPSGKRLKILLGRTTPEKSATDVFRGSSSKKILADNPVNYIKQRQKTPSNITNPSPSHQQTPCIPPPTNTRLQTSHCSSQGSADIWGKFPTWIKWSIRKNGNLRRQIIWEIGEITRKIFKWFGLAFMNKMLF